MNGGDDCVSWKTVKLGDVCKTSSGGTPNRAESKFYDGTIPWVKSGELKDGVINETSEKISQLGLESSSAKMIPSGTLLIALYGATVGKLGILNIEAASNQAVCAIYPNYSIHQKYLFHYLFKIRQKLIERSTGGAQPNISQEIIRNLQIPLPPLPEQKRIAEVLDQADALREKRRLALQKLDSLTQSIFIEMFGDPVRNPNSFEKTELKNLIKEFRYGTSNKSTENGYYTLRIPNIIKKEISFDDLKKVPVTAQELEKLRLKNGDVLFVRTNGNPDNVGRCAVFNRTKIENAGFGESEFIFASYLIRARLDLKRIEPIFLQYYLLTDEGRKLLLSKARTSAGQYNINTEGLGNLIILFPPIGLQNKFAEIVKKIEALKAEKLKSAEKIEHLFQSLQQRAFKGELFERL